MANGRTTLVAIGALLFGALIGAWSGRASQRALEEELEKTKAELEAAKKQAQSSLPLAMGLRSLMEHRSSAQADAPAAVQSAPTPLPVDAATPPSSGAVVAINPDGDGEADPNAGPRPLEAMAATWRLRATQSRASFIEAAGLSQEQQTSLQQLVDQMNGDVKAVVQQNLERIDFDKPPQMRDMVDLGVALGEVYQDTDDQLRRVLSEEQISKALEVEYDIFGQIDPDVVMPLMLKLEGAH